LRHRVSVSFEWLREVGSLPSLDESSRSGVRRRVRPRSLDGRSCVGVGCVGQAELSLMSGPENAGLWQPEALDGSEWSLVRELAASALGEL
jgi:hypothetical protein